MSSNKIPRFNALAPELQQRVVRLKDTSRVEQQEMIAIVFWAALYLQHKDRNFVPEVTSVQKFYDQLDNELGSPFTTNKLPDPAPRQSFRQKFKGNKRLRWGFMALGSYFSFAVALLLTPSKPDSFPLWRSVGIFIATVLTSILLIHLTIKLLSEEINKRV